MTKEEVLELIKEYQDYDKTNDYPENEFEINEEELQIHEEVATALREELDKNPEFFYNMDKEQVKEHIRKNSSVKK